MGPIHLIPRSLGPFGVLSLRKVISEVWQLLVLGPLCAEQKRFYSAHLLPLCH